MKIPVAHQIAEPWRSLIAESLNARESHGIAIEQLEGKIAPHRREIEAINKAIHLLVRGIVSEAGLPQNANYNLSADGATITGEIESEPTPTPEGSV